MTLWQPGMRITDVRLNDYTPVPLTSTPTAAAGFSLTSFSGRKSGGTTEWAVVLSYSGATITASSTGNIGDTLCCTLPSDCWPGAETYEIYEVAGVTAGSVRLMTNGQCLLTTLYPTSSIGANTVKFGSSFQTG
ncbi:hypothetical protein [Streptomyces cupreus]|uniref:Uncharacterized protein n=1 Tax=Streptomyces cupreus TaxID=2759956 RepID=A0A7X1MAA3_9ACTN|nr:hypothetical protein [Streptomyces cupreus]MBC2903533.1 hypothetical protein [Streptomyces cupreus]